MDHEAGHIAKQFHRIGMPVVFLDVGLKNRSEHRTYRAGSYSVVFWILLGGSTTIENPHKAIGTPFARLKSLLVLYGGSG